MEDGKPEDTPIKTENVKAELECTDSVPPVVKFEVNEAAEEVKDTKKEVKDRSSRSLDEKKDRDSSGKDHVKDKKKDKDRHKHHKHKKDKDSSKDRQPDDKASKKRERRESNEDVDKVKKKLKLNSDDSERESVAKLGEKKETRNESAAVTVPEQITEETNNRTSAQSPVKAAADQVKGGEAKSMPCTVVTNSGDSAKTLPVAASPLKPTVKVKKVPKTTASDANSSSGVDLLDSIMAGMTSRPHK